MGAFIVVGAQWGDECKGMVSAYLNARYGADMVCRAGVGPNAEHGVFLKDEKTYLKTNQLPLGWIFNRNVKIRIGSGVAVNPNLFLDEIKKYHLESQAKIDYRSPIVEQKHMDSEKLSKTMAGIGSTFSGSGYCRADFIHRIAKQAKDIEVLKPYLTDVGEEINECANRNTVIVETSQGTFLSLAVSPDYPNTTSDNVTSMAAADDVLLNWQRIQEVYLAVKAVPSREGMGSMGISELSESEIMEKGLMESSSIGGKLRRKASGINFDMLQYACKINGATKIALTFCDHYDKEIKNVKDINKITKKVWKLIEKIENLTNIPVTILNTGKAYNCIIDLTINNFDWTYIDYQINLSQ